MEGLLQSNDGLPTACPACDEDVPVSAFCRDCEKGLCTQCVLAHRRVRVTKQHRIDFPRCPVCGEACAKAFCVDCDEWLCQQCILAHRRVTVTRKHTILPREDHSDPSHAATGSSMGKTIESNDTVPEEVSERLDVSGCRPVSSNDDECALCKDGGYLICCDQCDKTFHFECHIPKIANESSGKWTCGLCTKVEDVRLEAPTKQSASGLTPLERKVCECLLLRLMCNDDSTPFYIPVPNKEYYDVIKNPMDFKKIRARLENNKYDNIGKFLQDIRLIFRNCQIYNKPKSRQWKTGRQLKTFFKEQIEHLLPYMSYSDIVMQTCTASKTPKCQKHSSESDDQVSSSESVEKCISPCSVVEGKRTELPEISTSKGVSLSTDLVSSPQKKQSFQKKKLEFTDTSVSPSLKPGLSLEKKMLSSEKTKLSLEKKGQSPNKTTLYVEKHDPTREKSSLLLKKHRSSSEKKRSSSEEHLLSSEKKRSSSEEHLLSSEKKRSSSEEHLLSSEKKRSSSEEHLLSSEKKRSSSEEHLLSSEKKRSSLQQCESFSESERSSQEKNISSPKRPKLASETNGLSSMKQEPGDALSYDHTNRASTSPPWVIEEY